MDEAKRRIKENNIIEAAKVIFARDGFASAKMDDIAQEAGITKVTLYSYFMSKENLYLAIVYHAFQALTENFYATISKNKSKSGLESTIAIFRSFFQFCEKNILYSESILDYFSMVRNLSRKTDDHSTNTLEESIFFLKIQDLQNLPLKLTVKEISRGMKDGSIRKEIDPMLHTIQGWTMVVGYIKLLTASGNNESPLLNVNLKSLKTLSLRLAELSLTS